jgi:flagellar motor switch protein FliN
MLSERQLIDVLADTLGAVIGTRLGVAKAAALPSSASITPRWAVRAAVTGAWTGTVHFGLAEADADWLVRACAGRGDEAVTEADTLRVLRQIAGQAAEAMLTAEAGDLHVTIEAVAEVADIGLPLAAPIVMDLSLGGQVKPHVACWASATFVAERPTAATPNLDVVLDIELPLTVRFGHTEMDLHALTRLGPGSVIDLNRSPDEQVDVMVNGRVVARGEVVVVGGNYGVRVIEVTGSCHVPTHV